MPGKKSIKTFDHGAHVPETASGLSMSASHTKCEDQIFVEGMKDGMYKHPGCQTDFVPFLSLTAPGTSSASAQCLLHTTRSPPSDFPFLCGMSRLHKKQTAADLHMVWLQSAWSFAGAQVVLLLVDHTFCLRSVITHTA